MNEKKIFIARNELENKISEIQQVLKLSEMEMSLVVEMTLSTARYKALVRNFYDTMKGEDDGNTNETR